MIPDESMKVSLMRIRLIFSTTLTNLLPVVATDGSNPSSIISREETFPMSESSVKVMGAVGKLSSKPVFSRVSPSLRSIRCRRHSHRYVCTTYSALCRASFCENKMTARYIYTKHGCAISLARDCYHREISMIGSRDGKKKPEYSSYIYLYKE